MGITCIAFMVKNSEPVTIDDEHHQAFASTNVRKTLDTTDAKQSRQIPHKRKLEIRAKRWDCENKCLTAGPELGCDAEDSVLISGR